MTVFAIIAKIITAWRMRPTHGIALPCCHLGILVVVAIIAKSITAAGRMRPTHRIAFPAACHRGILIVVKDRRTIKSRCKIERLLALEKGRSRLECAQV